MTPSFLHRWTNLRVVSGSVEKALRRVFGGPVMDFGIRGPFQWVGSSFLYMNASISCLIM